MKVRAKQFSLDEALLPTHNAVDLGHTDSPLQVVYSSDFSGNLTGAIRFKAKNETGSTINKGSAVYINGVSGDVPTISLADADVSTAMPAVGLTENNANNNAEVYVISFGNLTGLNTSTLGTVGQSVFIDTTAGALTTTKPTGTSSKLQNIGQIIRQHATEGIIKVGGAGRTAATPNLDEGHFFLGNASNQSVESAYQLPTSIGTSGYVLTSDGTNVTFQAASGGGGLTYTATTDPNVTLVLNNHYSINIGSATTLTLPTTGSGQISFKNMNSAILTIQADSAKTLDGVTTGSVELSQYEAVTLITDGSGNWEIR